MIAHLLHRKTATRVHKWLDETLHRMGECVIEKIHRALVGDFSGTNGEKRARIMTAERQDEKTTISPTSVDSAGKRAA